MAQFSTVFCRKWFRSWKPAIAATLAWRKFCFRHGGLGLRSAEADAWAASWASAASVSKSPSCCAQPEAFRCRLRAPALFLRPLRARVFLAVLTCQSLHSILHFFGSLPLPLASAGCACVRRFAVLGDHRSACLKSGMRPWWPFVAAAARILTCLQY